jgi:pyridoxal/pyridoxine/pyridoxamine kinase
MGDDGEFYVTPDLVPVYCDKVVAAASILTPNKFEAEHLTHRCIEMLIRKDQMIYDLA